MIFYIDLLNTIIQVFVMTYLPYYFLLTNKDIDNKVGKKYLIISSISIFVTCILATNIFKNSNMTATSITIISLIIIWITYRSVYKKALVAYSIAYLLVQIVAILVTSIFWPIISNIIHDIEVSRLIGIYIPAMTLELLIIKNKDLIKIVYENLTKRRTSLGIVFILVISMDFLLSISMTLNGWANVFLNNLLILMIVVFIIGVSVYRSSMDKKYDEINMLNNLLIDKNNELKKIKHDYGSQISYINGLYIMKQYDRLGEMLKNIINGNTEVSSCVKYITNRDSIISTVVESLDLEDIHIVIDEGFNIDTLDISEYEIHKILSNILRNAITELKGKGLIIVKTYKIFNRAYISIKNNGPKIDPRIIDSIFDRGFTTKNDKDGSHGYGLHIVKEIVENKNGKIYVISNEEYTEFKIIFSNKKDNV